MKLSFKHLVLMGVLAGITQAARAVPILLITDGTSSVTVSDGGAGDVNGVAGAVTFVGRIGLWTLNVTTGVSASPFAKLDLNSVDGSAAAAGTLWIYLSDTGFTTPGFASASIGGTTSGTATYQTFWDPNNVAFATTFLLTSQTFNTTTSFSGNASSSSLIDDGLYSMTEVVTITQNGAGVSSFGATMRVPDGGTTALLLGLSLLGIGFVARQFKPV